MTNGPRDPRRRAFLRLLGGIGAIGAIAAGFRLVGEPSTVPPPAAQPTTTPPTTVPPTSVVASSTSTSSPSTTVPPPPLVVEVISKEGWGAADPGPFRAHRPVRLTFHHAAAASSDPAGALERIREYQRFHQDAGWPDVAYHFLVDQAGRIYEGRPVGAVGDTFTNYDPTGHFLVCLDGNFDVDVPTSESIDASISILAWAAQRFDIDPQTLTGHRDHSPETTCPGEHAYRMLDEIAHRIGETIDEGRPIELRMTSVAH